MDGGRRRHGRDHVGTLREQTRRRDRAAHRPAGQAHPRLPTGPIRQIQLSRLHHRPRGPNPVPGGRSPSPPRRDRERHPDPASSAGQVLKYGMGLNHLPLGRFPANPEPAEGGLAGRTDHRPQPGSPDRTHRSGRAYYDHQDAPETLLLPRRTHHPQSPPLHSASSPKMALAKPVQQSPFQTACPAAPFLIEPDSYTALPNRLAGPRRAHPECLLLQSAHWSRPSPTLWPVKIPSASLTHSAPVPIRPHQRPASPSPFIPRLTSPTASLRRIRCKRNWVA